jgi:hypothetical protein
MAPSRILELSRIDAGMVSVATEQFDAAEAIQAISAIARAF